MASENKSYDHIIAGAGLSGLSLAYKLSKEPYYKNKRVLVLDKDAKTDNDRTWCYWSKETDDFEQILHHRWPKIRFASPSQNKQHIIQPYEYRMIRGIDFYKYTLDRISAAPNIDFRQDEIQNIQEDSDQVVINTNSGSYIAPYAFKSYPDNLPDIATIKCKHHFVWQHFKGWVIESAHDCFDDTEAVSYTHLTLPTTPYV